MSTLPEKPQLELNQGIEVEVAMNEEKKPARRKTQNYEETEFKSPEIIEYTGKESQDNKTEQESEVSAGTEKENPSEEVEDNLLELRKLMGLETKADKDNSNKELEVPEEETNKEEVEVESEEKELTEEDVKPKKRLRRKDPAPSMEDMAKLAGQAAAEAIKQRESTSDKEESNSFSSGLDSEDQATYDVFKQMEDSNPDKYKGSKEKFARFVEASKSYQKNWMSNNPGERFDPDAEEHSSFYSENEPKYSQSDFKKAERRVEMHDVIGEVEERYQSKIDELEDKLSNKANTQPVATEAANNAIQEMVNEISPEIGAILAEKGPEEAEKSDPLVFDKISAAADSLSNMVYEIQQNANKNGNFSGNSRNETHKAVSDFLKGREKYVKSLPSSDRNWNGKEFATNSEYNKMSDSDRNNHWTIDASLLTKEIVKEMTQSVSSEIEQSRKMLERYGVPNAGKKSQVKKSSKTKNPNKPVSPESSATPAGSPNLNTGTEEISSPQKELADMLWG